MTDAVYFDSLVKNIPYERSIHEYNLRREPSYPRPGNTYIILPQKKEISKKRTLTDEVNEFSGCVVTIVPIDDRYLGCRIILNRDIAK